MFKFLLNLFNKKKRKDKELEKKRQDLFVKALKHTLIGKDI